jgi:hypothetical protein
MNSRGEKLTKKLVDRHEKLYLPIRVHDHFRTDSTSYDLKELLAKLNGLKKSEIVVNIAGNGIYTMKQRSRLITQEACNSFLDRVLTIVFNAPSANFKVVKILTGGQTGFDEAGAWYGFKYKIPTYVLLPSNYRARGLEPGELTGEASLKRFRYG